LARAGDTEEQALTKCTRKAELLHSIIVMKSVAKWEKMKTYKNRQIPQGSL